MFKEEHHFQSRRLHQTAVEVEVWKGSMMRNTNHLLQTLCTYSLDNGPLHEEDGDTMLFRFTLYDWEKNIIGLLAINNIHHSLLRELQVNVSDQLLKKKIFLADDDPDILFSLSTILKDAGYQVKVAAGGQPVVSGNYAWMDLFILDQQMPDIDGLEICRFLRSQAATRETPVILLSAQGPARNDVADAGVNAYIEKPFEMHYLLNVISKIIRPKVPDNDAANYHKFWR